MRAGIANRWIKSEKSHDVACKPCQSARQSAVVRWDRMGGGQNGFLAAASLKRPCRCGAAREAPRRVAVNRCGARQRVASWHDGERQPPAAPVQIACVPPAAPTIGRNRAATLSRLTRRVCEVVHNQSSARPHPTPASLWNGILGRACSTPDPLEQSGSPATALAPCLPAGRLFSVQALQCTGQPTA